MDFNATYADLAREKIKRLEAINAELLAALEEARTWFSKDGPFARKLDAAIASAKVNKP